MKTLQISFCTLLAILLCSCGSIKKTTLLPRVYNISLECNASPDNHYNNLTHGIDIKVSSDLTDRSILDASECTSYTRQMIANSKINVDPTIKQFVRQAVGLYARSLGIHVGGSVESDYTLRINVINFSIVLGNQAPDRGVVELEYTLANPDNETLLRQTVRGRFVASNSSASYSYLIERAFTEALKSINWDGIAGYLGVPKRAELQPTTQVKGSGNTALESTIIRWNIESRPAGADVYWRVVSSTPDVKNTNATYLGSTPYESTESFDIRGLSYENSGNVQVEIKCERQGYISMTRRFNLRQVIDQKEISTKFNLVKDED